MGAALGADSIVATDSSDAITGITFPDVFSLTVDADLDDYSYCETVGSNVSTGADSSEKTGCAAAIGDTWTDQAPFVRCWLPTSTTDGGTPAQNTKRVHIDACLAALTSDTC